MYIKLYRRQLLGQSVEERRECSERALVAECVARACWRGGRARDVHVTHTWRTRDAHAALARHSRGMPGGRRGLVAPQNTFLENIIRRSSSQRQYFSFLNCKGGKQAYEPPDGKLLP